MSSFTPSLPSHKVFLDLNVQYDPFLVMGNELLLQQRTKKETTIPDIETEIECPRCYDIMVLSSDFERLYYFCEAYCRF
jgi:hypothetical protein